MKTKTWIAGLASATLVATVGFVAAGTTSNALQIGPVGDPVPVGTGTLTWKTVVSGKNLITTVASSGSTATQTFGENKCALVPGGTQYLLFEATTGPDPKGIGFTTGSLGVQSNKESTGTACRQVNSTTTPAESLTIKLNPAAAPSGAGIVGSPAVTDAALDLQLSGNAIVRAELKRGGTTVGRAQLLSGRTLVPPSDTPNTWQQQVCNPDSNSGPQSKFNNNCYWKIDPLTQAVGGGYVGPVTTPQAKDLVWDTIVLTLVQGDFSIQGGNAWPSNLPGVNGTIFNTATLSDGQIDCPKVGTDGTISYTGAQATASGDDNTVITRLFNGDKNSLCAKKPYSFSDTDNTTTFRYPSVAAQSTAQYAMKVSHNYTALQARTLPPLPPTIVNWEDGSADVQLATCAPGLVKSIGTDALKLPDVDYTKVTGINPATGKSYDQSDKTTGLQYACIYAQEFSINTSPNAEVGSITSTDYIYFTGDIRIKA